METREQHEDRLHGHGEETAATAVVENRIGYVLTGGGRALVENVEQDIGKPPGAQRIAIHIGAVSLYVAREHLPTLIAQLLAVQANGPVSA